MNNAEVIFHTVSYSVGITKRSLIIDQSDISDSHFSGIIVVNMISDGRLMIPATIELSCI